MVGKNNKFLKENKNNQRFLRFSLRKLSVGVVSVAIAAGFYIGGSQSVLADTTSTDPVVRQNAPNDDSTVNTDKNTVNQQSASTSADSSAVAGAADSTAAEAVKSAASAAEQQKTTTLNVAEAKPAAASNTANLLYNKATFNVAEEKPVAALNTANLLDNKAQSKAASDAAAATVNDDDLLKNIKISNPTDPKFVQYQNLVDRYNSYMSYHYGEEKPSQYVFSVIRDSRIDTDFIWTVDQNTGEKVSVYFDEFNNRDSGITGHHQFNDDNHNDYRYSKYGVTLSYDKPKGSSGSISVVDYNHHIVDYNYYRLDLGNANLQDVYEINGNTGNSCYQSITTLLPEKGQPIIKFLYRNPDTGKLMNLRDPIYYSNGLTGQKFELDIGDSYKQELKDMFAGFKLVGSSKASGTFTQFAQGKTYVEHDASDDSEVIYQQIDAEGTMKVFYREKDGEKQPLLDKHGNPYQLEAGSSVKIIDTGITAYNPFVTGDHAYELIYEPEDQSQVVNYVDPNGKVIKSDTITGKTTQTVNVTPSVPDHYELVPGQDIPENVTLKTDNPVINIQVTPKMDPVTDPAKLNKSISRTITINKPGEKQQVINQTATFERTGQHNEVTGEDVYTGWTLKDNTLEAVDAPAVPGYTPNVAHVDRVENPTADTKLANVVINYTADDQSQVVNYVDPNGKVIKSDTITGKTTQTVNVTPSVPDHYELVPGQDIPENVTLKTDNPVINIQVTPKMDPVTDPAKLNKSISRTITINKPGEKQQVINQTATFERTGQHNEVTGEDVYTGWTLKDNTLEAVDAPAVPGYTPNVAHVDRVENPTADTKLTDVTINYTANSQTTHINYVDKDGEAVKSDTVSGKTDETVKTNSEVPAGWVLVKGQHDAPATITFTGAHTDDITIKIEHGKTSVDHNHPVNPGDKTPSGKEIKGAHDEDLNQTITRTINVTTPDGQTTTTKQVAKIFRDATIDDVTGEVTYGSWSEDTWADFKPGQLAGCTASQADVPAVTVKDGQKDQTVDITYTANEGTVLIKYVDRDGNEIGQQVITGHVGDTIKVTPQFPENWVPVDPDTVPAEVQIKEENGQIIIVVVRHDEKDPVQTKKVTRTIMVTTPDGQTKTIKQVVTISRHGSLDLVTGQIAWQPWTTAQWDVFKPAAIAGYIPSPAEVPAVTVDGETTDQTVDITYAAVATPAQQGHQAPTASDTPDAQQATNQKADSNAQPAVTVVTSQQTATAQQVESTTNSRRLPQTGNSHDASALAGLGLASLLMGLFGLGGKRRKRD